MNRLECDSKHVPTKDQDQDAVRAHLAKILASPGFVKADRLCRFLRLTVEAKLNGEEDRIKEYVLGREVFDRNGEYDPRLDPIVRVEARRLRSKLEQYYGDSGQGDLLRFEFPKGSYIPLIRSREGVAGEIGKLGAFPWSTLWISGAALVVVAAVLTYSMLRPGRSGSRRRRACGLVVG